MYTKSNKKGGGEGHLSTLGIFWSTDLIQLSQLHFIVISKYLKMGILNSVAFSTQLFKLLIPFIQS